MKIFKSEAEMQDWIIKELSKNEALSGLVSYNWAEYDSLRQHSEKKIIDSYKYCMNSLHMLHVVSADEDICLMSKEILRPDILAYAPETQSMVIVELKNIAGPTRQAGTELSAYCAEINNYLPFVSDADVINVIISNDWPTLLCKHVTQDILWRGRKLICLKPYIEGSSIKLKMVTPQELKLVESDSKFGSEHIGGYHLCLYDRELYNANADRSRLDSHLPQMRTALSAMASRGNATGNHGFAFLWKDQWKESLSPYLITIVNIAPFNQLDRFLIELPDGQRLTDMQKRFMKLVQEYSPEGQGQSLQEITEEAKRYLNNFCTPQPENFVTWPYLLRDMNNRAECVAFSTWGIFNEKHLDLLHLHYQNGELFQYDDPIVGIELVNQIIDPSIEYINLSHIDFDRDL